MTQDLERVTSADLTVQLEYARELAQADIVPAAYRDKPSDILVAMSLGQAMGLSPAESLYRIDVIGGKPVASAELIASNVRRAGHILRIEVQNDPPAARATIIRKDDPEFQHQVVRDMAWARALGLDKRPNYRSQPATMLAKRATTAVARDACPEALYGVIYDADEMTDHRSAQRVPVTSQTPHHGPATPQPATVIATRPAPADPPETPRDEPDPPPVIDDVDHPQPDDEHAVTKAQIARIQAACRALGIERDDRLTLVSNIVHRVIGSVTELSQAEASGVIVELDERVSEQS